MYLYLSLNERAVIFSLFPALILVLLNPFQLFIWLTVTPYLRAMVDRVSPLRILW